MRAVEVHFDAPVLRQWHVDLLTWLSEVPDVVVLADWVPDKPTQGLERLIALEGRLHGLESGSLSPADPSALAPFTPTPTPAVDLVVDLTGSAASTDRTWRVLFDGRPGEKALLDALRQGRMPLVTVVDADGDTLTEGRPGSDSPGLLATELADVAAGVTTLVVGAVEGRRFASPVTDSPVHRRPAPLGVLAARRVFDATRHRIYRVLYRAPHWRVGWRTVDGDSPGLPGAPDGRWHDLPDDGHHFYADPFPFVHDDRTFLFVEDFDHRVGKGVISVIECDDSGPVGTPRPVLTHDVHLSYPFVLEHDGEVWMIPETSGARTVELYRAVDFPETWEREAVLLEGIEASDATALLHNGRWWLFATVGHGGSLSDSLHLWSADDLRGPWTPHAQNPVLVDIASARPAGRIIEHDGRLLRPAQDGRGGYGAALTLTEITRLDDEAFEQRVVSHLGPSEQWPGRRLHTLNEAGGIEVIDGSRMSPRFRRTPVQHRELTAGGDSGFTVQREDDLDLLGEAYSALYEHSDATPFQHGVWLQHVYTRLAPARSATRCIVTARRAADGKLVMVMPLLRRRQGLLRMVEFADLGVADYAAPVLDRRVAAALRADPTVSRRISTALGRFDLLRIERVADSPDAVQSLVADARSKRHLYRTHTVRLPGTMEAWRKGTSRSFNRYLKRKAKKLATYGEPRLRTVTDPEEIDGLMTLLQSYREARFRDSRAVDLVQDPDCFALYSAVARDGAAGIGPARLSVLEVDSEPVALSLDLVGRDVDYYLIPGYSTELQGCSLGLTLVEMLVAAAIDRGQANYDLTVGDESYKADFGAVSRPLFEVYLPRTALGHAAAVGRTAYLHARRQAKRALTTWESRRRESTAQKTAASTSS